MSNEQEGVPKRFGFPAWSSLGVAQRLENRAPNFVIDYAETGMGSADKSSRAV